jgi:hypothetical protein
VSIGNLFGFGAKNPMQPQEIASGEISIHSDQILPIMEYGIRRVPSQPKMDQITKKIRIQGSKPGKKIAHVTSIVSGAQMIQKIKKIK